MEKMLSHLIENSPNISEKPIWSETVHRDECKNCNIEIQWRQDTTGESKAEVREREKVHKIDAVCALPVVEKGTNYKFS